jgi:hypothetical protein
VPPKPKRATLPANWLVRQLHVYLSVFVAPSLIFFAGTGAFQTFRIPDRPQAPVLLQKLARLHRDDVFAVKPARPKRPPGAEAARKAEPRKPEPRKASTEVLKWFFSLSSVAMVISALLGVWIALTQHRQRGLMWSLLIAGTAAPVLLVVL